MQRAESVDHYLELHPEWAAALTKLRRILAATELVETVKWGAPCYTIDGKNVVGIAAFSDYVGLWFFQGVFLADRDKVLINAQENRTRGLRQWRFKSDREIVVKQVKQYVLEAIQNERQGKKIKPERDKPVVVPAELKTRLAKQPTAKRAFAALTKGRQREYAEYVSTARQASTKAARVEKILPMIEAGVGLNDRYRSC